LSFDLEQYDNRCLSNKSGTIFSQGKEEIMSSDRRRFLAQSLQVAGAALINDRLFAEDGQTAAPSDVFAVMKWMNEPAAWHKSGDKLVVQSRVKTDFWRKTFYGYITDNGHFFHRPANGEFTFEARVNGKYAALYDQAGLMVRLDAENWMKCGTEFFDGQRHASVVFTRDFSDWSTMPDLSNSAPVWWRAVRKKDSIETLCSLDGKSFTSVRQGYFAPNVKAEVGVMCAAPEGPGFESIFSDLKLTLE
jgi:regulation of enolase protein 1 (concanavalin A-like superfamily)